MSIRNIDSDLNIIGALADEPNDEDGLGAEELKAKFDEGGNAIKAYINDTLIPDVNDEIAGSLATALDAVEDALLAQGNMPSGGTAGQILVKQSETDYDAAFANVADAVTGANIAIADAIGSRVGLTGATGDAVLAKILDRVVHGGVSPSDGAAAAKTCAIAGFTLVSDAIVRVAFAQTNTAVSPTLNVSATGAKPIRYAGAALTLPDMVTANVPHLFVYDGEYWQLLNPRLEPLKSSEVAMPKFGNAVVTSSSSPITITLGFRPRVVQMMAINGSAQLPALFVFSPTSGATMNASLWTGSNSPVYIFTVTPTATGFTVSTTNVANINFNWFAV
ncbi:MAG: hypothetical protein LBN02_04135 [Oscillospiraceae bacterium]|jgi:hypothetical protein|nr:hypothetical protein [Oscillospiraceae bacterium]